MPLGLGAANRQKQKKQRRIAASSSLKGFVIDSDTLDGQSSTPQLSPPGRVRRDTLDGQSSKPQLPSPWRAKRAASIKNKTDESAQTICLGQQLEQLYWKQQILCPKYWDPLVGDAIDATTIDIETRQQNDLLLFHTAYQRRYHGKSLFIYLDCGVASAHSSKRLFPISTIPCKKVLPTLPNQV